MSLSETTLSLLGRAEDPPQFEVARLRAELAQVIEENRRLQDALRQHDQMQREALDSAYRAKDHLIREVNASRMLLRTFQDQSPNHSFIKTEDGRYLSYNRAFAEHFGIDQEEWIGRTDHEVLPRSIADSFREHELQALESGRRVDVHDHFRTPQGNTITFRSILFPLRGMNGEQLIGGVGFDITEETFRQEALKAANKKLERLASVDALTGLFNRRFFDERMDIEFAIAVHKRRPLSVLVMDIDDFKRRNDEFGHSAGDEVLRTMGEILLETARVQDVAARVGGEEFGLLLPETNSSEAQEIAETIQERLREVEWASGPVTLSIGVAGRDFTTEDWKGLVTRSDEAMYKAKRSGKNRIVVHQELARQMLHEALEQSGLHRAAKG